MAFDESERNNFQYIIVEVDAEQTGLTRDELLQVLQAEKVRARRYFYPGCHRMEPYRALFPHAGLLLPETEALADRVLAFPNGLAVDTGAIALIGQILRTALANASAVRECLAR